GSSLLHRPSRTEIQWPPHRRTGTDEGEQLSAHSGEGRAGFPPASRAPRQAESSAPGRKGVQPCASVDALPPPLPPDRCPGILRPPVAADGALGRRRVPGGQIPDGALRALSTASIAYADGDVHLTSRGNLQLRGIELDECGAVPAGLADAVAAAGLLPSASHERVRNIVASPLSGLAGGLADVRPLVREFDAALCADPALAELPGRFLFGIDDGRGDIASLRCDLTAVALGDGTARIIVGGLDGPTVPLAETPGMLL